MKKCERSKELNNIFEAIDKWVKKHNSKVQFIGSFIAFKGKEFQVVDDRILAYGFKDMLRDSLKDLDEIIEKEKDKFINW